MEGGVGRLKGNSFFEHRYGKKRFHMKYSLSYSFNMRQYDGYSFKRKNPQRLLQVKKRLVLPIGVPIRLLVTASDVLHSWAVPALGVKVDAIPGRLSSVIVNINRPGYFFGQCSELCGPMHGFMPIVVEAVTLDKYIDYLCYLIRFRRHYHIVVNG
jgi:heme/copper-type cytochrome/quinol oxidase subunit 2